MTPDAFDRGPNSGPLYRDTQGAPPILAEYPDDPQYDLATIVHQVGVRPLTLWSWEQQLGIPQPEHGGDGTVRRYSERDLVACIWIRDQLLQNISATKAAAILLRAQPPSARSAPTPTPWTHPLAPGTRLSAPPTRELPDPPVPLLGEDSTGAPPSQGAPVRQPGHLAHSGQLDQYGLPVQQTPPAPYAPPPSYAPQMPPAPFAPSWDAQQQPGASGPRPVPPPLRPPVFSGPLQVGPPSGPLRAPAQSGPLRGPARSPAFDTNWPLLPGVVTGPPSGPLRAASSSGPLRAAPPTSTLSNSRWPLPSAAAASRDLRAMAQHLVRAFASFETNTANRLVDEVMRERTVEVACVGLLLPALGRVAEMSAHRQMSNPEERFAVNFVRGRLHMVFMSTPERFDAPVAVVACAPRELDDIGALTLATFWRRAGLRVVFLGQDTDGADLIHEARTRRPRLICVCATLPQRVRALARIARGVSQIDAQPPLFTYSGAPFARNPELQDRVMGVYLGDDPATATWRALRLLGVDRRTVPPPPYSGAPGVGQAG